MQSRSGSSLIASIFAAHGYKTRHDPNPNAFDYVNWEHLPAKRWAYARKPKMNYRNGHFVRPVEGIDKVIKDGDCVKMGVEYWPLFNGLDYKLFVVRRDPEQIARSLLEKQNKHSADLASQRRVRAMVELRESMLDHVRDHANGVDVFPDEIVRGDFSSLERGFAHHGLTFNPERARKCIDPSKWHKR